MAKRASCLVLVTLACVIGNVAVAEEQAKDPLAEYAKLTKGTEKAICVLTASWVRTIGQKQQAFRATIMMVLDTKQGKYKLWELREVDYGGRKQLYESHILFTPDGSVDWEVLDGEVADDWSRHEKDKTVPGEFRLLKGMVVLIPFGDAAFGYEHMRARTVLTRIQTPPKEVKEKDKLEWYRVTDKPDAPRPGLLEAIAGEANSQLWIGFAPKTGWPTKLVVKMKARVGVLEVSGVNLKPNLKDRFGLPDKIKAAIARKGNK